MAKISEHVMEDSGYGRQGHMHAGFATGGTFTHSESKGSIVYAGSSVVIHVDGRDGHFHIDFTDDLEKLIESIEAGEYNNGT